MSQRETPVRPDLGTEVDLAELGFTPFFQTQCPPDAPGLLPARVMSVERTGVMLLGPGVSGPWPIPRAWLEGPPEALPTVGDWVLVDPVGSSIERLLERSGVFQRRAAGGEHLQLIAANVDTALLVSACNRDFSVPRLERYLALALAAGAVPVVVLTKADLTDDPRAYVAEAARLRPGLPVEAVNALACDTLDGVRAWCAVGSTVALLGSSGVGKSTLLNSLAGHRLQATSAARDADDRGRHTTTRRSLHRVPGGAWLLDSPGMRELGLVRAEDGLREVFADLSALARQCRFRDCEHRAEPGCAVRGALEAGQLDVARLARFHKLAREERHATATVAERRAEARGFGRTARAAMKVKQARKE